MHQNGHGTHLRFGCFGMRLMFSQFRNWKQNHRQCLMPHFEQLKSVPCPIRCNDRRSPLRAWPHAMLGGAMIARARLRRLPDTSMWYHRLRRRAGVAELADAPGLGPGGETREGSSPFARTIFFSKRSIADCPCRTRWHTFPGRDECATSAASRMAHPSRKRVPLPSPLVKKAFLIVAMPQNGVAL